MSCVNPFNYLETIDTLCKIRMTSAVLNLCSVIMEVCIICEIVSEKKRMLRRKCKLVDK